MKRFLICLLAAGLSLSLYAADIFTYAPIKGVIKSYTETEYTIASKFGNYFRTPSTKITHSFDAKGKETSSVELTARDVELNRITSNYDAAGNLTEQVCTNADKEIIWKMVTTYKNGVKQDVSEYDAKGNLKDKTTFVFEGKNLIDETSYDGDGALMWKTIYKYNATGKIDVICEYNNSGSLSEQESYTYTESGDIDSITHYDAFTGEKTQRVFRYGTDKLLSEITTYDSAKQVTKRVLIKYDEKGNVTKVSDYNVAEKFGTTVNELVAMSEYVYTY